MAGAGRQPLVTHDRVAAHHQARQQLVVVAAAPYGAGEQAFISYGGASNGSLLLGSGFALRRNRFDAVEVTLTAKCDARRRPAKAPPAKAPQ